MLPLVGSFSFDPKLAKGDGNFFLLLLYEAAKLYFIVILIVILYKFRLSPEVEGDIYRLASGSKSVCEWKVNWLAVLCRGSPM
jgi:hypothetical protein